MNIENLRNKHHELLFQMKASGYSEDYIHRFRKEIHWILTEAEARNWKCYKDIYQYYKSLLQNHEALEKKHAILGALEQFDIHGKYPDSKWNNLKKRETTYQKLVIEFRKLIDHYVNAAKEQGKKQSTIYMESGNASNFLFALQESGFERLDDITEAAVMSIFVSPEGRRLKCNTYRKSAASLLKACIPVEPAACTKVLSFLPKTRSARKNIQYLTEQEVKKIREALDNMDNGLSLCDRAIGKLALYTGLRGSDIATMKFTSIDWEYDIIRVTQQKTGVPLELPLTATVGNAIYDYLTNERPPVDNPFLFLSLIGPNREVACNNMWNISARIMKAAGVRQASGDRKGLHIFRHNLATTLLGNEVNTAVISRMLGHSSPDSTETYLSADFVHLKACALSISHYPVSEEVLNIG